MVGSIENLESYIKYREKKLGGQPMVGYISPDGDIIDFSLIKDYRGHDEWRNEVSIVFLQFLSYHTGKTIEELKSLGKKNKMYKLSSEGLANKNYAGAGKETIYGGLMEYPTIDKLLEDLERYYVVQGEYVNQTEKQNRRAYNEIATTGKTDIDINHKFSVWDTFERDVLEFLHNCYSGGDFFRAYGRDIILNVDKVQRLNLKNLKAREGNDYKALMLISHLKDIAVQYLGYDSIERGRSTLLEGNDDIENYKFASEKFVFKDEPREITTSYKNMFERFYNYLLMDWKVTRVPKYHWNEKMKMYLEDKNFYLDFGSAREESLATELDSIKRNYAPDERAQFMR